MRKARIFLIGIHLAWIFVLATGVMVVRLEEKDLSSGEKDEGTMYLASKMLWLEGVGSQVNKLPTASFVGGTEGLSGLWTTTRNSTPRWYKATMDQSTNGLAQRGPDRTSPCPHRKSPLY